MHYHRWRQDQWECTDYQQGLSRPAALLVATIALPSLWLKGVPKLVSRFAGEWRVRTHRKTTCIGRDDLLADQPEQHDKVREMHCSRLCLRL